VATLEFESLSNLEHRDLKPYRTLRRRKDLERQAQFVAEGDKVVQRLLESPFPVESLLITEEWLERIRDLLDARADTVRVFLAQEKAQIEQVTGFGCYQGIKAVGRIPQATPLEAVLDGAHRPRLLCALDGISNAENVGVIVRNAAAMGVQALIVGETSCSPFLTRAIRTSMGAIFRLPAVENLPLGEALDRLRIAGVRCVAAHPSAAGLELPQADLRNDCCLVLGSEGFGRSDAVLRACDQAAAVPMSRAVDSLNVSSAAAVFFYEAWRQRGFPTDATDRRPAPG
jgi:tRNA G18 (ribose-2'-O)-methylase SpoU